MSDSDYVFAVGDRVRVVERHDHDESFVVKGAVGVVTEVDQPRVGSAFSHPYRVRFADDVTDWLKSDQLEAVTESQVWKVQVPEEPAGVTRVRSVRNPEHVYVRNEDGTWSAEDGFLRFSWSSLVNLSLAGVELVPEGSDYEVSLDYLRRNSHLLDGLTESGVTGMHAAAVLREVIENG